MSGEDSSRPTPDSEAPPDQRDRPSVVPPSEADLHRLDHRFWEEKYGQDPDFFGFRPSPFARWAISWLGRFSPGARLVELGCGNGRDIVYFHRRGFSVAAVDRSRTVVAVARDRTRNLRRSREQSRPVIDVGEARAFLRHQPDGSAVAIYSNLFYNMPFSPGEHHEMFNELVRVLAHDGVHLYSVRTVNDPWYGKGRRLGDDLVDLSPNGPVMHFFSQSYSESLTAPGFRTLAREERTEGGRTFPIVVLYVAESHVADSLRR